MIVRDPPSRSSCPPPPVTASARGQNPDPVQIHFQGDERIRQLGNRGSDARGHGDVSALRAASRRGKKCEVSGKASTDAGVSLAAETGTVSCHGK